LNAGCSGFLYGLAQSTALIESGVADRVLLCGSDVLSRVTDYSDPRSCVLFGDGAGAVVVEKTETRGLGPFILRSDGSRPELLEISPRTGLIQMDGREVYRRAVDGMTHSVRDILREADVALPEVDLVVAHQANARIIGAVADRLGVDEERVALGIAEVGNTSAASIPLTLEQAQNSGRLNDGDTVVLTAFGAGFVWGAGVARWSAPVHSAPALSSAGETRV
jgi:3-oxoacyl-[acyl-carrier-protein] synthase-3